MRNLTPNFCFRLDDLKRRIVALRNDLRSFKLEQKGKLSFVSYLILSPNQERLKPVSATHIKETSRFIHQHNSTSTISQ